MVETYPYEQLSHAVLRWLQEDIDRCDVIHGHEWGGIFSDLVTSVYLRNVSGLSDQCTPTQATKQIVIKHEHLT